MHKLAKRGSKRYGAAFDEELDELSSQSTPSVSHKIKMSPMVTTANPGLGGEAAYVVVQDEAEDAALDSDSSVLMSLQLPTNSIEPMELEEGPLGNGGGSSTITGAVLNFVNSIVGAGVVGLSYALMKSGIWAGIVLLCGVAFVVDWSVRLLITTSKIAGRNTYQDMMQATFGRRGLIAISIFQFSFAFGAMCAYIVIVGDTLSPVLNQLVPDPSNVSPLVRVLLSRRFIITAATLCIMLPLSLYRDISKLAKTSAFAVFALFFIWLVMVIVGPFEPAENRGLVPWHIINPGFLQAIGVISFAFVCHHNTFLIFSSLKRPTLDSWARVAHWSVGLSLFLSLGMAVSGYLVFGSLTQANILNNFSSGSLAVSLARVMFAMNMFTTYPLEAFVCREVIANLVSPGVDHLPTNLHVGITTTLIAVSLTIALSTCNLGVVLELTGCFSATALAYIFPPAMYLKWSEGPICSWKKVGPLMCLMFGIALMLSSTFTTIQAAFADTEAVQCNW
jgi:solute carrier family 38 (sodium-coupled neutral amino acid transporter), member 11